MVSDPFFPTRRSSLAILDSSSLIVLDIRHDAVRGDGPYNVLGLMYRVIPIYGI